MAVIKPLKIVLTNYDENKQEDIVCLDFPMQKDSTTHTVKLSKIVFIDADDFKLDQLENKRFFGLTVGKTVRLKYAYNIKCLRVIYEANGTTIKHLECEYDSDHSVNVKKGHLTWVSGRGLDAPIEAEFRLYDHLFSVEKPGGEQWLSQLNASSELIYKGLIDKYVLDTFEEKKRYQFERCGYFVKDADSDKLGYPVFNRTVALNEGNKKSKKKKQNNQRKKK